MLQAQLSFNCSGAKTVQAYFHAEYFGMWSPLNSIRFVNVLKNDLLQFSPSDVEASERELVQAVRGDWARIVEWHGNLTVCGVPRSKREASYPGAKMGLKRALRRAVQAHPGLEDGLDFIVRHTDTLCTHRAYWGHGGNGEAPRNGLARDTCTFSPSIAGRDILLIDDIYTPGCGIDEDAISAVFDANARSVIFYALGYTARRGGSVQESA